LLVKDRDGKLGLITDMESQLFYIGNLFFTENVQVCLQSNPQNCRKHFYESKNPTAKKPYLYFRLFFIALKN
jgi:hypothetical protein